MTPVLRRPSVRGALLLLVSLAGCFETASTNELSCTKDKYCPDGYVCVGVQPGTPGKCQKASDSGVDGAVAIDSAILIDGQADLGPASPGDGPIPSSDGAQLAADLASRDQAQALDAAVNDVAAADARIELDLASPTSDASADAPMTSPDLPADRTPDKGPNLGPDASPDLGPDASPDLGPDAKALGAACTNGNQCEGGFCVSGVCCNRACTGACEECTAASRGICSYKSGTECAAATSCTNAAVCSGSSSNCPVATPKQAGTPCGTITCSGSTQSGPTCNGSGTCGVSTSKECYPYACVTGSGCKTSCTTNSDCVSGSSSFCGKNGACTVDAKCWHVTDGSSGLLWQVNPQEPTDTGNTYDPKYHTNTNPGSTPADVCDALNICGFDDWTVPTISELRSLVRGCSSIATGGTCAVTDSCLDTSCDVGCALCDNLAGPGSNGCYWPEGINGPCSLYWSSSIYYDSGRQSYRYRYIDFTDGNLWSCDPSDANYVRCVRHMQ